MSGFVSQTISWTNTRLPNAHPSQIFQSVRAVLKASKVSRSVVALPRSCASRLNIRAFSFGFRNLAFSGQGATIQKEAKATRTVIIPSTIKILQSHGKGGVRRGFFIGSWKVPSPTFVSSHSIHLGEQIRKELIGHQRYDI